MKQFIILPFLVLSFFTLPVSQSNHTTKQVHNEKKCPVCKSDKDVIPIVYGKPGTELMQKAERGECKLGGCIIDKDSPRFYCKKDKKEF